MSWCLSKCIVLPGARGIVVSSECGILYFNIKHASILFDEENCVVFAHEKRH